MAKRKKSKQPKQAYQPSTLKKVKQAADPNSADKQTLAWRISQFDYDGPWGNASLEGCDLANLIKGWASKIETQTWGELLQASGGRKRGSNHHPIEVPDLSKAARKRLNEIRKDDFIDSIFSLRVDGAHRVYGIRDGRVFNVLWYDPWHNNFEKGVCPSNLSHT